MAVVVAFLILEVFLLEYFHVLHIGRISGPTGPTGPTEDSWPALKAMLEGRILFLIPVRMKQGKETKVTIRISANASENLANDLRNEKEGPEPPIVVENVSVLPHMTVKLVGGKAFDIVPLTPEEQFVAKDTFTQWQFNVTPLKSGEQELDLLVGVRVTNGAGGKEERFHPTYERKIVVEVDRVYIVEHFVEGNWQWLISAILLPFIGLWIRKRRKRLDGEKEKKGGEEKEKEKKGEPDETEDDDGKDEN
jgi:hypothetical protein